MIDAEKVKQFWQTRSDKWKKLPFESIANLEEDAELLKMKTTLEQERIMPLLPLQKTTTVLDLGAGVGQWSFRFAPLVKRVVSVEYMEALTKIARAEAKERQVTNVECITSPAETFQTEERFDLVFISGLFVYLNENQAAQLMRHLPHFLNPNGMLLLRDGTSILENAYHINHRHSDILNESYSAYYRTRKEYLDLFQAAGFRLMQDGQVFDEGCPLNKFKETRLWYYLYAK